MHTLLRMTVSWLQICRLGSLLWLVLAMATPAHAQIKYYLSEFKAGKGFEVISCNDTVTRYEKIGLDKMGFVLIESMVYRTTVKRVMANTNGERTGYLIEGPNYRGWATLSGMHDPDSAMLLTGVHEGKPKVKWRVKVRAVDSLSSQQRRAINEAYLSFELEQLYGKIEEALGEDFQDSDYLVRFGAAPPPRFQLDYSLPPHVFRARYRTHAAAIETECVKNMRYTEPSKPAGKKKA